MQSYVYITLHQISSNFRVGPKWLPLQSFMKVDYITATYGTNNQWSKTLLIAAYSSDMGQLLTAGCISSALIPWGILNCKYIIYQNDANLSIWLCTSVFCTWKIKSIPRESAGLHYAEFEAHETVFQCSIFKISFPCIFADNFCKFT